MPKGFLSLCSVLLLLLFFSPARATTLVDSLTKLFKQIDYPNNEVLVKITLKTEIPQIEGDRSSDSALLAYQAQSKLVSIFKQNGWRTEDALLTADIDAGLIELELDKEMNLKLKETLRLKAYVHPCDSPMHKYRGGSLDEFFQNEVLEKAEQCFTYDEKLQGKNFPY